MTIKAIVTMPPYVSYLEEVAMHPIVSGIRLNTVMPVKDSLEDILAQLSKVIGKYGKELWIDLKYRQLRTASYGVPPFTEIELSHEIEVDTPCKAYFSNGREEAIVLRVNKNRLIMQDGPRRVVGPGESVNIPYANLKVKGSFTEGDVRYIEAGKKVGVHKYMLSFVESRDDVNGLLELDEDANVVAKIESRRGVDYARYEWNGEARLMAARGDLFIEVGKPHEIIAAVEDIIRKDANAIAASRIFDSLGYSLDPTCEDIGDADNLMRMGYKTLMFGDHICLKRDSIISGLNLLEAMARKYNIN